MITITIRVGKFEKERLMEAAKLAGMTLSGFLRDAGRIQAHKVFGGPKVVWLADHEQKPDMPE
jgi:uncharacterized protein (DUF1778 family)